ncbi:DUF6414 family protein [Macrococcoides caseolyticum]|uniref:DUF6414 family protein n=1 Tax=Macrococcoides caseolyticum TaxID=69966 RepID=UPI000C348709|nr:DUF6414 family protein [Macrococcus caseolyticus]PKE62280.1 hypothetical protein CW683_11135 [Macrococcus caseolyticus]
MVLTKIIYFDRETMQNFLQVHYKGKSTKEKTTKKSISSSNNTNIEVKLKLAVPLWDRISFLFNNKLSVDYFSNVTNTHTISSTDLSEFDSIKQVFKNFKQVTLSEIENSSTTFRMAGGYMKVLPNGLEEIDIVGFNEVMDQFEGYDTYKISNTEYVRFNNSSFISNYKKNDVLLSVLTLYCIKIGDFEKEEFDFLSRITNMEKLFKNVDQPVFLSDLNENHEIKNQSISTNSKNITLYDVVLAEIGSEDK